MKPLSILRIMMTVDPRYGGPVEAVRTSALEMAKFGHRTEVLTLDDPAADYLSRFPVPVHAIRPWMKRYGYTPALARWIGENSRRFDIAVIEGLWNHGSVGGSYGLRAAGLPYVVFTHGMMDPWFRRHYPLKHWVKQFFWLLFQGNVLGRAKTVLFTCEEERLLAHDMYVGPAYKEQVVSFGTADVPPGDPRQAAALYDAIPGLRGRRFLLFLSRLHAKKGLNLLVPAFARIAGEHPDVDLVIAGPDDSGLEDHLKAQAQSLGISGRIHWPGMLMGDAKWGAFREADAFVLTSHSENFGIVVAEALACGTPVLISNRVNIWREVEADGAGLVADDDIEGASSLLSRWLDMSPEDQAVVRGRSRRCFETRFHIAPATRSLIEVLYQHGNNPHDK